MLEALAVVGLFLGARAGDATVRVSMRRPVEGTLALDVPFNAIMPGVRANADLLGVLIATLGGTAGGLERQWSGHAGGPEARFAGIRTFTMLGGLAGLSGWLWTAGLTAPAVVLLGAAAAITAAAYVAASRRDVDGTTEIAALVVMAAGVTAGIGAYRLASGIIAITSLLLVEKSRLHALAARIDDVGLRAGVRFAVMALVVLPLLPRGPYGPDRLEACDRGSCGLWCCCSQA